MFEFKNRGHAIQKTNYWGSGFEQAGLLYLSWVPGCGRLLVPDQKKPILRKANRAPEVAIASGRSTAGKALELLFDDGSDDPPAIYLLEPQCSRLTPLLDEQGQFCLTAWTRHGLRGRWPGRFAFVPAVPWLRSPLTQTARQMPVVTGVSAACGAGVGL